jgi:hypothetical protein
MIGGGDGLVDRRIERKKLVGSCLKIANVDEGERALSCRTTERDRCYV